MDEVLERALTGEARRAHVAAACAGDAGLEALVAELLREIDAPEGAGFFDRPAAEHVAPLLDDLAGSEVAMRDVVPSTLARALSGRYRIEREIGRGGMAVVYLAQDLRHPRRVAIKVMDPALSRTVDVARFRREVVIDARLEHPRVVPFYEAGEAEGLSYFVMRYIDGESLRRRLERERKLPVELVLAIGRQVAEALDHAHACGVIHRDVKPDNILLVGRDVFLADFGIAKLVDPVAHASLTRDVAIGSVHYMSPEQVVASPDIDGRADVYALACVMYEMLAGEPPFTGPDMHVVLAKHLHAPVPDLRIVRRTVNAEMQRALERALHKSAADRPATAGAFMAELEHAVVERRVPHPDDLVADDSRVAPRPRRRRWPLGLAAAGALLAVAHDGRPAGQSDESDRDAAPVAEAAIDTLRVAVFPIVHEGPLEAGAYQQLLSDMLSRWRGVVLVDAFQVDEALRRGRLASPSTSEARDIARALGANRFVRGRASRIGAQVRLEASLYAIDSAAPLRSDQGRLRPDLGDADSVVTAMTDRLLFGDVDGGAPPPSRSGTWSAPAYHEYGVATKHIAEWDLVRAEAALDRAVQHDSIFARAHLWRALVRAWRGVGPSGWAGAARRAGADARTLGARDSMHAVALTLIADGDRGRACPVWERMTQANANDVSAWYSLGMCLAGDGVVVRDPASPSRWRFRSSYGHALEAYRTAFELLPSIHRAFGEGFFAEVRQRFVTARNVQRAGVAAPPDTGSFRAYAEWDVDSLRFVPYPAALIDATRDSSASRRSDEAARHMRDQFLRVTMGWVNDYPESARALEALAVALELTGDPAALDTIRRAAVLARGDAATRQRIVIEEIWMRLKFALPGDADGLIAARSLADSLIGAAMSRRGVVPAELASVAALTGRATLAASILEGAVDRLPPTSPRQALRAANALLMYSAMGGPAERIRDAEARAWSASSGIPEDERAEFRSVWLARAATLAFPRVRHRLLDSLGRLDPVAALQAHALRGDPHRALAGLRARSAERAHVDAADVTIDGLLPEAALRAMLADSAAAAAELGATLTAFRASRPFAMSDPAYAGSLVRAMALYAQLASARGDTTEARRWARAVTILWADADPAFDSLVARMRAIAG